MLTNAKHPFDFDVDYSMGEAVKREFFRCYEVDLNKNQWQLNISTEVGVKKFYDGNVIGGMYNCRQFWIKKQVKTSKLYALVRRSTLEKA